MKKVLCLTMVLLLTVFSFAGCALAQDALLDQVVEVNKSEIPTVLQQSKGVIKSMAVERDGTKIIIKSILEESFSFDPAAVDTAAIKVQADAAVASAKNAGVTEIVYEYQYIDADGNKLFVWDTENGVTFPA